MTHPIPKGWHELVIEVGRDDAEPWSDALLEAGALAVQAEDADAELLIQADAALLHSPRAAQVLAKVLKAHPAPALRVLGLSKAVIKPLARTPLAAKAYPPFPLEAALLNLIDRTP